LRFHRIRAIALAIACICGSGCSALFESSKPVFDLGASQSAASIGLMSYQQGGVSPFITIDDTYDFGLRGTRYSSNIVSCDVGYPGSDFRGTHRDSTAVGLGLTYLFKERIGIYGGWSYADRSDFHSFYDPTFFMDDFGNYHVDCGSSSNMGLIYGAHLFLNETWVLGVRQNDALEETFISIGFDVNRIEIPTFFGDF
jgi:hypothetical protein